MKDFYKKKISVSITILNFYMKTKANYLEALFICQKTYCSGDEIDIKRSKEYK